MSYKYSGNSIKESSQDIVRSYVEAVARKVAELKETVLRSLLPKDCKDPIQYFKDHGVYIVHNEQRTEERLYFEGEQIGIFELYFVNNDKKLRWEYTFTPAKRDET